MATELAADTTADPVAAAVATPNVGAETPPRPSNTTNDKRPLGFLSYANGALKRHYPTAPAVVGKPAAAVSYKECMRNHAASMGGHALDGCCEFMPSPATFNPDDPTSLRCAACGCHRNFHRRDPDDPAPLQLHRHRPQAPATLPFFSPAPQHMPMATPRVPSTATDPAANGGGGGKKRFRTKFSEEQKAKMREFSARCGWKIQKIEKGVVEEFCREAGVGREVLKVWMHNHKNTHNLEKCVHGGEAHNGSVDDGQFHHRDVVVSFGDGSSSSSSGLSL